MNPYYVDCGAWVEFFWWVGRWPIQESLFHHQVDAYLNSCRPGLCWKHVDPPYQPCFQGEKTEKQRQGSRSWLIFCTRGSRWIEACWIPLVSGPACLKERPNCYSVVSPVQWHPDQPQFKELLWPPGAWSDNQNADADADCRMHTTYTNDV